MVTPTLSMSKSDQNLEGRTTSDRDLIARRTICVTKVGTRQNDSQLIVGPRSNQWKRLRETYGERFMSRCDLFHLLNLSRCARGQIETTFASSGNARVARVLLTFIITHVARRRCFARQS